VILFKTIVLIVGGEELKINYGEGDILEETCPKCGYQVELYSAGVHESNSGVLRIYADDDQFICPRCIEQPAGT